MLPKNSLLIAVDFDGTIVEDAYPKVGTAKIFAFDTLLELQQKGHRLILWTYRYGDRLQDAVDFCKKNNKERILLCGVSDLAEIAMVRAMDAGIRITGVYDPASKDGRFFSKPVWTEFSEVGAFDMCLLTSLASPYEAYKSLIKKVEKDQVLVPEILGMAEMFKKEK